MKKTITDGKDLIIALDLKISDKEEEQINTFLKNKVMHVIDKKITYPKYEDVKKKETELAKQIDHIEKELNYWKNSKSKVQRNQRMMPINMYFKKNFWRHKIKELTNKEYKQDVIDSKLTDKVLLDPEYKTLFETFLVNPDYREKLKETINNSIVYKHSQIGEYSERKKVFKIKTADLKIEQLKKNLIELNIKKDVFSKIIEIIKKHN